MRQSGQPVVQGCRETDVQGCIKFNDQPAIPALVQCMQYLDTNVPGLSKCIHVVGSICGFYPIMQGPH
jgi:hypothetical protein